MSALRRETSDSVDELFRSRWGPSVRLATALTGNRTVAEEMVQEAFLEVSKRWTDIDNHGGYLRTVLVNRCRNHHRRVELGRRRVPPPPPLAVDEPELDEMWTALAGLSPRRRTALVLRYCSGARTPRSPSTRLSRTSRSSCGRSPTA
jgi:RNA polymerase sigma factor (sigma-70 family)